MVLLNKKCFDFMRIFFSFIFFLISGFLIAQIDFKSAKTDKKANPYPFSDEVIISEIDKVPCYVEEQKVESDNVIFSPTLTNIQTEIVDGSLIPADVKKIITNEFSLTYKNIYIKKQTLTQIYVRSLRKNSQTGSYERLVKFDIKGENIQNKNKKTYLKRTYATQSVLNSGTWYKISTNQNGIHKVTYENLIYWGIDVSNIQSSNIRLFNNGPRMLPEKNSISRCDDLCEIPIYVSDGSDGVFGSGDYFLFYTEGISYWDPDTTNLSSFTNLYSDKNYCFLTFDNGSGLRLAQSPLVTDAPTHFVDRFVTIQTIEPNLYNLFKSGKNWYGDIFDGMNLSRTYSFSFPNICNDELIKIFVEVAGRSSTSSSFKVTSGANSSSININPVYGYTDDYAKIGKALLVYKPSSSNINVSLSYNQSGNSEAMAWLDYVKVMAWQKLNFYGNQMTFCNPRISGAGTIAEYSILNANSATTVWDITNPLNPKVMQGNLSSGIYKFKIKNDSICNFIAFNGASFFTPSFAGRVENQNLHGLPQIDYIIVSHSSFLSQANEIGRLHKDIDGLSYIVVTPELIYNEFSCGKQDIVAIRDFVKMFYDRALNPNEMPKYLLLFGDASYDYKNRVPDNTNFVPTFQSLNSLQTVYSCASDDFFALLDEPEGYDCYGHLDVGVGRFTVSTLEDAQNMVEKVKRYISKTKIEPSPMESTSNFISNMADWRNVIAFVSDDGNGNLHYNQSDRLAEKLDTTVHFLNIDKIYLDAYKQISTSGGEFCPEVNAAINQRVEKGALIVNYIGHGGINGWADERILDISTIKNWKNKNNMPFFITATCDFSHFDNPSAVSPGEHVVLNPNGGGIAIFTSSRSATSGSNEAMNTSFFKKAFDKSSGDYLSMGDLVAFSKNDNGANTSIRNFLLIGDPALKLSIPENNIVTSKINGQDVTSFSDTIKALNHVTVEGYITDVLGNKMQDFNGTVYPSVFDKKVKIKTLASDPSDYESEFTLQKNIIFKGKASVVNSDFKFSFIVPKDIQYTYDNGRISYYAENGSSDATGWYEDFIIGGASDTLIDDNSGPSIELFMNNEKFINGGITNNSPILLANLYDKSGINTIGSIGHDITATLDNATSESVILNDYYEADKDSYTNGKVTYPYKSLSEGKHNLKVKVWDILNNSAEASIDFVVASSLKISIDHVLNYPNPFTTRTSFMFEHNQPNSLLDVQIQIFTISGKIVKTINTKIFSNGFNAEPIEWDGRDDFGDNLAKGVYLYRLRVRNSEGKISEKTEKLVILK